MKNFNNKKQIFEYLIKKFSKDSKIILIRGSTAKGKIKQFSDIDIEIYSTNLKKPYYEIAFVGRKIILISVYFYKFKEGEKTREPKNVKIIYGNYNNEIKPDFSKDRYSHKEKVKREAEKYNIKYEIKIKKIWNLWRREYEKTNRKFNKRRFKINWKS